ncbi:hypothetical protein [Stenotrophomonas maltophilia]|uniref:hypothetical protein n=1 Tax=Stenotrophomonas maltophilia TaxID=40324 RepID=UPI0013D9548D|nr:hypothetical protein [Stenotrophomonas maltophilia]
MSPILSESNNNRVEMLATRIDVQWDFRDNDGPVLFFFDRVDWNPGTGQVNTRSYDRTVRAQIRDLLAGEYTFAHPLTGEQITEPGWKLMALIKAATDRVWEAENPPAPEIVAPPAGGGD